MANSFNVNNYPNYYSQPQRQQNGNSYAPAAMLLAGVGGGVVGYCKSKHPISKDGKVSDNFAREVLEKYVKKNGTEQEKNIYEQSRNILKKIGKTETVSEFKELVKNNSKALSAEQLGMDVEKYVNSVTETNLKENKETIKKIAEGNSMAKIQTIKNQALQCWDKDKKSFKKSDNVDSKLFDIIKKTKSKSQWKKALKYGGVAAGIMGALTVGYKIITANN